ncbi:type VI secretion system domain-containing protein [Cronobacter turicensis]|uniref:type VI secretion system domain-containing protein n=1 Tax=Cronobacter turicensis TaxID=413502 RepID=UPI003B97FEA1
MMSSLNALLNVCQAEQETPSGADEIRPAGADRYYHRGSQGLLTCLHGLETLTFNDGTPFTDEVTMKWLSQDVALSASDWHRRLPRLRAAELTTFCNWSRRRWRSPTQFVSTPSWNTCLPG